MYQSQSDKPFRCSPQETTPSGTPRSFRSHPQPTCHVRMSQKNYQASLDRMNKTVARTLDTANRTHLLLLELGVKLGLIPPVTSVSPMTQPLHPAPPVSTPHSGVLLARRHDTLYKSYHLHLLSQPSSPLLYVLPQTWHHVLRAFHIPADGAKTPAIGQRIVLISLMSATSVLVNSKRLWMTNGYH